MSPHSPRSYRARLTDGLGRRALPSIRACVRRLGRVTAANTSDDRTRIDAGRDEGMRRD